MTHDEQRALAFIAALLLVSAAVRFAALPEPVDAPASAGFDVDAHIEATARAVATEERRSRPLAEGERLDPNRAPVDELVRIRGIGPAMAARIVESRERDGRFRSVEDLTRVPGIGEKTAARLAPHLAFPPAARGTASGGMPAARGIPGGPPPLDLNRADAAALTGLSGVGPVLAARIVAYRDSAGPFPAVDSLVAVKGIGPATLAKLRGRLVVR